MGFFGLGRTCLLGAALGLLACSSGDEKAGGNDAGPDEGSGGAPATGGKMNAAGGNASAAGGRGNAGGGSNGGAATGTPGTPGQVGGCDVFTADDAWNQDVSKVAADATWTTRLQNLVGSGRKLHPDYGNAPPEHYGIPVNVVPASQPAVPVTFDDYPDESDDGPYPFPDPASARIEGGTPQSCDGDCHFIVVQSGACMLYEGYACTYSGSWHCANGARWDLSRNSYGQRPKGWTSADAAGLAILPGLVRLDEVRAGKMTHAIRFTLACTRANFVAPATHQAVPGGCNDPNAPPMGLRVRLKSAYDTSALSKSAQVVANAMKTYGMILADNGSNFYFQGEDNPGWTEEDVEPLKTIPASEFEALPPGTLER